MNSEYYVNWEDYVKKHPKLEEIEGAKEIQNYEEQIYRYIFSLFL